MDGVGLFAVMYSEMEEITEGVRGRYSLASLVSGGVGVSGDVGTSLALAV